MNFESLTIAQLRKLTDQYEQLEKENKILRVKFPTKNTDSDSAEKLLEELNKTREVKTNGTANIERSSTDL